MSNSTCACTGTLLGVPGGWGGGGGGWTVIQHLLHSKKTTISGECIVIVE